MEGMITIFVDGDATTLPSGSTAGDLLKHLEQPAGTAVAVPRQVPSDLVLADTAELFANRHYTIVARR